MTALRVVPALEIRCQIEEARTVCLVVGTREDESRLRLYLSQPSARMRIEETVADVLDQLEEAV